MWRHAAELACMFWPSERWQRRVESVTNEQAIIVHERTRPQNIVRKAVERSVVQVVQPSQSLPPPLSLILCNSEIRTSHLDPQLSVLLEVRRADRAHLLERPLLVVARIG